MWFDLTKQHVRYISNVVSLFIFFPLALRPPQLLSVHLRVSN